MKSINFLRKIIIKKRIDYLQILKNNKVEPSLSSFSSFRTLLFNDFCSNADDIKINTIDKKINKINFIYQIKNFIYILKFSKINIVGDYSKDKLQKYKNIIVAWSNNKDFNFNGEYYNKYFNITSKKKNNLWFLIHTNNSLPKKIKKNIIILHPKKTSFGLSFVLIFKYFFKTLLKKNFSIKSIYHESSFDSLIANKISSFFKELLNICRPKKIIFPYESQPFQNALVNLVKKNKSQPQLIGYDHTSNPFPIYNTYNSNSPDLLYVHSHASKIFYSKYLKWPTQKVKKTPSLRIIKKKSSEFKGKIFLPYDFFSSDKIIKNFELFLKFHLIKKVIPFKIMVHPARKNSIKHLILKEKFEKTLKFHVNKFSKKSKKSVSIHIGNTSTVIEALEAGVPVTHILCDPIFDLFSTQFWPTIIVNRLSSNIFEYSIKKFGKCLIFKNKMSNFNKFHK